MNMLEEKKTFHGAKRTIFSLNASTEAEVIDPIVCYIIPPSKFFGHYDFSRILQPCSGGIMVSYGRRDWLA